MKVLIYGLPGSGKTYLAEELIAAFGDRAEWFNADTVRTECDDWDFSKAGRERQSQRMRILADQAVEKGRIAVCDFICPLQKGRVAFGAGLEIFMDTIEEGRFADTNRMFERPVYDAHSCIIPHYSVKRKRDDVDAKIIVAQIEEMIKSK